MAAWQHRTAEKCLAKNVAASHTMAPGRHNDPRQVPEVRAPARVGSVPGHEQVRQPAAARMAGCQACRVVGKVPQAFFMGYGDSTSTFMLFAWLNHLHHWLKVKSDLATPYTRWRGCTFHIPSARYACGALLMSRPLQLPARWRRRPRKWAREQCQRHRNVSGQ
jgi:hypothetical protein